MEGILEPPTDFGGARPLRGTLSAPAETCNTYPVQIVVADVENVLFEIRPWESWLISQLQSLGVPSEQLIQRWYRSDLLRCANAGLISIWHAWHDFLLTVGASPGWVEELVIGIRCRYDSALARCRMHPDACTALKQLQQQKIQFAILADSHWQQPELQQVLTQLRLPVGICQAVTTAMLGASGPEPKPYLDLLQRLSVPPHSAAYVGWNRRPLEAARRAEMVAIRFNGQGPNPAHLAIQDLRDLPKLLVAASDHRQAA